MDELNDLCSKWSPYIGRWAGKLLSESDRIRVVSGREQMSLEGFWDSCIESEVEMKVRIVVMTKGKTLTRFNVRVYDI